MLNPHLLQVKGFGQGGAGIVFSGVTPVYYGVMLCYVCLLEDQTGIYLNLAAIDLEPILSLSMCNMGIRHPAVSGAADSFNYC